MEIGKAILLKLAEYIEFFSEIFKFKSKVIIYYENNLSKNNSTEASICLVDSSNISDAAEYEGSGYVKRYKKFLAQGDIGYYAYLDNRWVHCSWVKIGPQAIYKWVHFPPFTLKAREAYCHFGKTLPMARGHNIAPTVLSTITKNLQGKVDHIYTRVDEKNVASRRAVEKAGFVEKRRQQVITILGFNFQSPAKKLLTLPF